MEDVYQVHTEYKIFYPDGSVEFVELGGIEFAHFVTQHGTEEWIRTDLIHGITRVLT